MSDVIAPPLDAARTPTHTRAQAQTHHSLVLGRRAVRKITDSHACASSRRPNLRPSANATHVVVRRRRQRCDRSAHSHSPSVNTPSRRSTFVAATPRRSMGGFQIDTNSSRSVLVNMLTLEKLDGKGSDTRDTRAPSPPSSHQHRSVTASTHTTHPLPALPHRRTSDEWMYYRFSSF